LPAPTLMVGARGVGRLDHPRAAGGPDEVDPGVVEEVLAGLVGRVGHDLEGAGRQAGGLARALQDLDHPLGAPHGSARRAEDHGVAGLGRDDGLEQHGGGGVGDGGDGEDDADGLGHVVDAPVGVGVDHADAGLVLQVVVEELGGDVVLDDLVLEDAEPGLLDGELGEVDGGPEAGHDHGPHDGVDLLLVEVPQGAGGLSGPVDHPVELAGPLGADPTQIPLG